MKPKRDIYVDEWRHNGFLVCLSRDAKNVLKIFSSVFPFLTDVDVRLEIFIFSVFLCNSTALSIYHAISVIYLQNTYLEILRYQCDRTHTTRICIDVFVTFCMCSYLTELNYRWMLKSLLLSILFILLKFIHKVLFMH